MSGRSSLGYNEGYTLQWPNVDISEPPFPFHNLAAISRNQLAHLWVDLLTGFSGFLISSWVTHDSAAIFLLWPAKRLTLTSEILSEHEN